MVIKVASLKDFYGETIECKPAIGRRKVERNKYVYFVKNKAALRRILGR